MPSHPALANHPTPPGTSRPTTARRSRQTARAVCATAAVALIGPAALPAADAAAAGVRRSTLHYVAGTSPTAIPQVGTAAIVLTAAADGTLRRVE